MKWTLRLLVAAIVLSSALAVSEACPPPTRFELTVQASTGAYGVIEYETSDPARPQWLNYETFFFYEDHNFSVPLPAPIAGSLALGALAWCGWLCYAWSAGRRARTPSSAVEA